MNKSMWIAAASVAACMAGAAVSADKVGDVNKAAQNEYNAAVAKAKSNFDKAIAACKKQEADKQSACFKEARHNRREARDAAADAYTKATGRPEPSPGA